MDLYNFLNNNEDRLSFEQFSEILKAGNLEIRKLIVGKHSLLDGVLIKNSNIPVKILIGPLIRKNEVVLADGNTILHNNDILILIGKNEDIGIFKDLVKKITVARKVKNFVNKLFMSKKTKQM